MSTPCGKKITSPPMSLALACVFLPCGCGGPGAIGSSRDPVQRRAEQDPEGFAELSEEQKKQVRDGQVYPDFTARMVWFALGDPDSKRVRRTAEGVTDVWIYRYAVDRRGSGHFRESFSVPTDEGPHTVSISSRVEFSVRDKVVGIRIEFVDGKVVSVERGI